MLLTLMDVDQLLDNTALLDSSTPAPRLRGGRDDLVHVAVLLSYARHVLSVDIGALEAIAETSTGDLQDLVDDMPRVLEAASIGGGWSLSPDAPPPRRRRKKRLTGAADGLMPAHAELARLDPRSPRAVRETLREIEVQVSMVSERRELVEKRVREIQALLVEQYKRGDADPDDWVR